ncbi:hypothetical protein AHAS_Ahas20G0251600 [Arachis hypogaea]
MPTLSELLLEELTNFSFHGRQIEPDECSFMFIIKGTLRFCNDPGLSSFSSSCDIRVVAVLVVSVKHVKSPHHHSNSELSQQSNPNFHGFRISHSGHGCEVENLDINIVLHQSTGICALYERKLKELNPAIRNFSYDIADLYNFMDGLADMSALVYDHSIHAYMPHDRQWIKQRTLRHLKKFAH